MSEYLTADAILEARKHGWPALLRALAKPVNPALIKQKPGRGNPSYIPHHTLRQYLHVAFDYTSIRTELVIDKGDGKYGLRCELTCRLGDDVRTFHGWGESDNAEYPLKSAESDAFRRICGMDLGLGLALWAGDTFFLSSAYGDETVSSPSTDGRSEDAGVTGTSPPLAPAPVSPKADEQPTEEASEGDHGEGSPSEEPVDNPNNVVQEADTTPKKEPAVRAKARATFMAITQGSNCGLNYERDVKPFLQAHYGGRSWSELTDKEQAALIGRLTAGDKDQSQRDFAAKVKAFNKEKAA